MTPRCANCGLPDHRYGTGDPNHEPDKTACINQLRAENDRLRRSLRAIAHGLEMGHGEAAREGAYLALAGREANE